jgi:hypothetical protein
MSSVLPGKSQNSFVLAMQMYLLKQRKKLTGSLILLLLFGYSECGALSPSSPTKYINHLGDGLGRSFDEPKWLFAAGAIAALSNFDSDVQLKVTGKCLPKSLSQFGKYYGYGLNWVAASCLIIGDGFFDRQVHKKETLEKLQLVSESFWITFAITGFMKYAAKRERPDRSDRLSFPSGHSSGSFSVATSMSELYGRQIGTPSLILGVISGLSRLNDNKHWLSDVLSGALLGSLIGKGFAQLHRSKEDETQPDKKRVMMIAISYSF